MAPAQPAQAPATTFCSRCGSPVASGSGFCAKCGAPVAPAAPPPPPTYQTAPPPTVVYAAPPPPAKKSHKVLWIVIAVVVVVIGVVLALVLLAAAATSISVSAINFTSSDNACGMNSQTTLGFTTGGGSTVQESVIVTGGLFLSCTINTVSATTAGFSVSGANVPLTVAADGSQTLTFNIHVPSGSYSGVLTIDVE